jgi:uncharacterized membrane protein YedE/YeeE
MPVRKVTLWLAMLAAVGANVWLGLTLTHPAAAQCGVGGGGGPGITSAALSSHGGNAALAVTIVLVTAGGGSYVYWNERRLRAGQAPSLRAAWAYFRQAEWSPYAAGVLLGTVNVLAVILSNRELAVSGGVQHLVGSLGKALLPSVFNTTFYNTVLPPQIGWYVVLLVGIFLGALLGAWSSGTLKVRWNDDPVWPKVLGDSKWKRALIGFLGATLVQFGAGIAGGCTSGLAISGGMVLAPSAYIFIASMFISGIVTALVVYGADY